MQDIIPATPFITWFDTFLDEKGIDTEILLSVEGESGANIMPLSIVTDLIKQAPAREQQGIKDMLVRIDFANAPVLPYFKHLAKAIAA